MAKHQADPQFPGFSADDVRVEKRETLYAGFCSIEKLTVSHAGFSGETLTVERELLSRRNAVCVLPYDPVRDEVVLIEQFRIGTLDHPQSPWLLELVAGVVEPGESIEEVAHRETFEEAGLELERLKHISFFTPSPGAVREYLDVFVGQVNASQAQGLHGVADEGEDIRLHRVSAQEAFAMLGDGRLDNAAAIIGVQWLQLNHQQLRQQWLTTESV